MIERILERTFEKYIDVSASCAYLQKLIYKIYSNKKMRFIFINSRIYILILLDPPLPCLTAGKSYVLMLIFLSARMTHIFIQYYIHSAP